MRLSWACGVERRHCNPGGSCHGGMLSTQADGALVLRLSGIAKPSGAHEASFTLATYLGEA